jgi:type IV pilus assembly protein PilQ
MRTGKVLAGVLLIVAAAALAVAPVSAQETSAMRQVGMVRTGSGTFSLDVEGADIRTVIRAIAEFSGKNIVVNPNVKSSVKLTLRNVSWEDALRTTLRLSGLDYVEEGGIIRVDEASKLASEANDREAARSRQRDLLPLETRIVKLNYANASELNSSLNAGLSKRGTIQAEKRTNSLIITDLPEVVGKVTQMAMDLDTTTPQIEITAKLVDVDEEALRNLGITWGVPNLPDPTTGNVDLGTGVPAHPGNDQGQQLGGGVKEPIGQASGTISYALVKNWLTLEAKLQMLEQQLKANIISNPRITTVDNREARILVGQKIPLIVQDVAGNPVSQLQTIGIQLKVTPHLTKEKKIIMDLHPEVSDLSTQSTVQGGVIINTSEADTRVMVDDGQTAVIGGLIRTNQGTVRRGVPVLKDLPVLGQLFRSDSNVNDHRELVIFVTPRIMNDLASK